MVTGKTSGTIFMKINLKQITKMNILFFGNGDAAMLCIEKLIEKLYRYRLLVVTPYGGKLHDWHIFLSEYCAKNKIKYISPENVNSKNAIHRFKVFNPDIIFSVYYTQILSDEILKLAKHAINFHPSLLPKYRGPAPLIWAIINSEKKTGITAHEMTSTVDKGRIYAQKEINICFSDTGYTLHKKAAKKCADVFESILSDLNNNALSCIYPRGKGRYYSSNTLRVNHLHPLEQLKMKIYNIVRALSKPLPNAYILEDNQKYLINKVSIVINKKLENKLRKEVKRRKGGLLKYQNNLYISAIDGFLKLDKYEIEK